MLRLTALIIVVLCGMAVLERYGAGPQSYPDQDCARPPRAKGAWWSPIEIKVRDAMSKLIPVTYRPCLRQSGMSFLYC
jgi:hypothetical protein